MWDSTSAALKLNLWQLMEQPDKAFNHHMDRNRLFLNLTYASAFKFSLMSCIAKVKFGLSLKNICGGKEFRNIPCKL